MSDSKDHSSDGGAMASRRDAEAETASESRNDLVLLVDDDPVARLLTASALAERQWRVIEADGGAVTHSSCLLPTSPTSWCSMR